ncbi:MAG TPA: hypothetical protein VFW96_29870 [Thermomicrobiales bacterium]|nr:hypothetical protein [Thermomicrobiales bacterium]
MWLYADYAEICAERPAMYRQIALRRRWALLGLALALAAIWTPGASAAAPGIGVEPSAGPCLTASPTITVRGGRFQPGQSIAVVSRRGDFNERVPKKVVGVATVAADGTFVVRGPLADCDPQVADGMRFTIDVVPNPGPTGILYGIPVLASATFTKYTAPGAPNTGAGGGQSRMNPMGQVLAFGGLALALAMGLAVYDRRDRRAR